MSKFRFFLIVLVLGTLAGVVSFWRVQVTTREGWAKADIAEQEHERAAVAAGAFIVPENGVATLNDVAVPFSSVFPVPGSDNLYSGMAHLPGGAIEVVPGDRFSVGDGTYLIYDLWCVEDEHRSCNLAVLEEPSDK